MLLEMDIFRVVWRGRNRNQGDHLGCHVYSSGKDDVDLK